jgi:hypothetical protein
MSHEGVKLSDTLHKEIANKLRFGGFTKDKLDELVGVVAQIHQHGLAQLSVYTKGTTNPDGVEVRGVVSAANISSVLNNILTQVPRYTGVVIFPYGIISPEAYQVNVHIGREPGEGSFRG